MMQIYVQSCGASPNHDYIWLRDDNQQIKPPLLHCVDGLRQKNYPSIVIAKYGEELILLIFGLTTRRGVDFQGREIFNSVVWIGKTADEAFLRMLAACALRKDRGFLDVIDRAVIPCDERPGFKVAWQQIKALNNRVKVGDRLPDKTRKIGKNSQKLRYELAEELSLSRLPDRQGAIVVVTGIVEGETLKKAGVWRSLSRLVDVENWHKVTEDKDLLINLSSAIMQFIYVLF
ncbi:hypothetical protein [Aerosakkonema funiforme]|uniref:hypothetical protein n=1 Tax=Aerosakkonema funiforme TaxID=1246630 RepID=UPI0035BB2438